MKFESDQTLRMKLLEAYHAKLKANDDHSQAQKAYDESLVASLVKQGFGKDARVRHVHSSAHHGNESDKEVISRVCNAYTTAQGAAFLRIQLGSVKGGLSNSWASLLVADVLSLEPSVQPFRP